MDVKDAEGFDASAGCFVEDHRAYILCTNNILTFVREQDEKYRETDTNDPSYQEDPEEWASDIMMNYVFYRFVGNDIPARASPLG